MQGARVIGLVALNSVCRRHIRKAICWKEARETHLHCEPSFFLLVCLFEVSLRGGRVSSWGLAKAVFAEQAHCLSGLLGYIFGGGRLKVGESHPVDPPLLWRQIPGRAWWIWKGQRNHGEVLTHGLPSASEIKREWTVALIGMRANQSNLFKSLPAK